jgi:hypothetical protein
MLDEGLAPLLVAPSAYIEARNHIRAVLGFPTERLPFLIGIDGVDGAGKSSLAAWLSWQLEMPTIALDLFIVPETKPIAFETAHLEAMIAARLAMRRPLIVEGILLLDALTPIRRQPDLLIFVEKEGHSSTMEEQVRPYIEGKKPHARATYVLTWSSSEYDARVARAHLHAPTRSGAPSGQGDQH